MVFMSCDLTTISETRDFQLRIWLSVKVELIYIQVLVTNNYNLVACAGSKIGGVGLSINFLQCNVNNQPSLKAWSICSQARAISQIRLTASHANLHSKPTTRSSYSPMQCLSRSTVTVRDERLSWTKIFAIAHWFWMHCSHAAWIPTVLLFDTTRENFWNLSQSVTSVIKL